MPVCRHCGALRVRTVVPKHTIPGCLCVSCAWCLIAPMPRPALTQCAGPASNVVRTALRQLVPSASHNSRALLLPPPGQQLQAYRLFVRHDACHVMSPPHRRQPRRLHDHACCIFQGCAATAAVAQHGSPMTQSVSRKLGVPVLRGAFGLQPCAHNLLAPQHQLYAMWQPPETV